MTEPWNPTRIFAEVVIVLFVLQAGGTWVIRSLSEPERTRRWLVVVVAVGSLSIIGYFVAGWLALPPIDAR